MNKIKALHAFIVQLDLFAAEQMDSCVDDLTITPACRMHAFPGQIVFAEMDYTATFYIERFPHGQVNVNLLLAHISAWLLDNDPDRLEPVTLEINIEVLDAQTANLEFGIVFNELILGIENPIGKITANGIKYTLL